MLLPIVHAVIYRQGAPSAALRGATASSKLLPPPLPSPAAPGPPHSGDTSSSPAWAGNAFTSPLGRQEFIHPFCCEARAPPASQPWQASPHPAGTGGPGIPLLAASFILVLVLQLWSPHGAGDPVQGWSPQQTGEREMQFLLISWPQSSFSVI